MWILYYNDVGWGLENIYSRGVSDKAFHHFDRTRQIVHKFKAKSSVQILPVYNIS